jgi:hypothetical protein
MSIRHRSVLAAVIPVLTFMTAAPSARQAGTRSIMPTDALHQATAALNTGDRSKQKEIVSPFLGMAKKTGLSPEEDMALGELYFLALNPSDSDAIFVKYLDRTDKVGRMAWIRHGVVTFRAFDKRDEAERDLPRFRQQFAISADDLTYSATMVGFQAGRYAESGNHAKVVEMILEDVKPLTQDVPYRAFRLVGQYFASFAKVGRAAEARTILETHRARLQERVSKAAAGLEPVSELRKKVFPHRPGLLHSDWDTAIADDDPTFDRDRFNTQMAIDRIKEIDDMLAKAAAIRPSGHW